MLVRLTRTTGDQAFIDAYCVEEVREKNLLEIARRYNNSKISIELVPDVSNNVLIYNTDDENSDFCRCRVVSILSDSGRVIRDFTYRKVPYVS